jgi:hypothetical protein
MGAAGADQRLPPNPALRKPRSEPEPKKNELLIRASGSIGISHVSPSLPFIQK